jgi:voltage-gated potassium channel
MWEIGWRKDITKKFYRKESSPIQIVLIRLTFIIILLLVVAAVFWIFEKDNIKDNFSDGNFSYIDSLYFTIVTVTTLGYGDIVPITEGARMFDALIITPVRIIVWILFIGTAYQLVIRNYWERFKMNRTIRNLNDHTIIAGYGTTGAVAVSELILKGYNENNLVVIENSEKQVKLAAEAGATGVFGDPSSEEVLSNAGIKGASVLIIATHQDDTNVLITLTAKDLNPRIKIISRVSQEENIKQLKRAGANIIISPSLTSGHLMAMAVTNSQSVELIEDLLTTSRGVNVVQRKVKQQELGIPPKSLKNTVILGLIRKGKNIGPKELDSVILKDGDYIISIE